MKRGHYLEERKQKQAKRKLARQIVDQCESGMLTESFISEYRRRHPDETFPTESSLKWEWSRELDILSNQYVLLDPDQNVRWVIDKDNGKAWSIFDQHRKLPLVLQNDTWPLLSLSSDLFFRALQHTCNYLRAEDWLALGRVNSAGHSFFLGQQSPWQSMPQLANYRTIWASPIAHDVPALTLWAQMHALGLDHSISSLGHEKDGKRFGKWLRAPNQYQLLLRLLAAAWGPIIHWESIERVPRVQTITNSGKKRPICDVLVCVNVNYYHCKHRRKWTNNNIVMFAMGKNRIRVLCPVDKNIELLSVKQLSFVPTELTCSPSFEYYGHLWYVFDKLVKNIDKQLF